MSFQAALKKHCCDVPLMKEHESLCQLSHLCTVTAEDLHSRNDLRTIVLSLYRYVKAHSSLKFAMDTIEHCYQNVYHGTPLRSTAGRCGYHDNHSYSSLHSQGQPNIEGMVGAVAMTMEWKTN